MLSSESTCTSVTNQLAPPNLAPDLRSLTESEFHANDQMMQHHPLNHNHTDKMQNQPINHCASSFQNQSFSAAPGEQAQQQQQEQLSNPNHMLPSNRSPSCDQVKQVELFGVRIVALTINAKERLCLAQISNTLLKEFSYNEIHNRRVALGITCVQCTPIQLEMLRRAGAMPSSSRRCGMITMREAERLCRSFLVEEQPPELPENFYFKVAHKINFGCKGRFIPARYISSRAKCIECYYCGEFYSPNKFIFHYHRQPQQTECNPPDSPNINSWRKHIDLDWGQEHGQDIRYAWEDVKSLFNGGTRRKPGSGPGGACSTPLPPHRLRLTSSNCVKLTGGRRREFVGDNKQDDQEEDGQLIDVECEDNDEDESQSVEISVNQETNDIHEDQQQARTASEEEEEADDSMSISQPLKRARFSPAFNRNSSIMSQHHNSHHNQQQQQCHDEKPQHLFNNRTISASIMSNLAAQIPRGFPALLSQNSIGQQSGISNPNQTPDNLTDSGHHQGIGLCNPEFSSAEPLVGAAQSNGSPSRLIDCRLGSSLAPNLIYGQLYAHLMTGGRAGSNSNIAGSVGCSTSGASQFLNGQHHMSLAGANQQQLDAQMALKNHLWSNILANLRNNSGSTNGASNDLSGGLFAGTGGVNLDARLAGHIAGTSGFNIGSGSIPMAGSLSGPVSSRHMNHLNLPHHNGHHPADELLQPELTGRGTYCIGPPPTTIDFASKLAQIQVAAAKLKQTDDK